MMTINTLTNTVYDNEWMSMPHNNFGADDIIKLILKEPYRIKNVQRMLDELHCRGAHDLLQLYEINKDFPIQKIREIQQLKRSAS